jgi:hypothetical protein
MDFSQQSSFAGTRTACFRPSTRITFADGSRRDERWDGRDPGIASTSRTSAIAKVEVDPDRVLLLDVNYTNNSWSEAARRQAAATWAMRWLTWAQELVLNYAFFA